MGDLVTQHCTVCDGGTPPISADQISDLLKQVSGWSLSERGVEINRTFQFKNYYQTIAFVTALA
jgi:4a-hydroxytetrahydrobiopterin dehydratase